MQSGGLRVLKGVATGALYLSLFAVVASLLLSAGRTESLSFIVNSERPDALKILFVGNSLTFYNDMPTMLFRLLQAGMPTRALKIGQVTYPGLSLAQQWNARVAPEAIEKSGPWDYVIIQEQSSGPIENPYNFTLYASLFDKEIRKEGGRTVLLMTWADKGKSDDQETLTRRYEDLGHELDCIVIPAGSVWFRTCNQYPNLALYCDDNHHPGPLGSYLVACTIYGVLTKSNPSQLPENLTQLTDQNDRPLVDMTKEQARQIQSTVWRTISDRL